MYQVEEQEDTQKTLINQQKEQEKRNIAARGEYNLC